MTCDIPQKYYPVLLNLAGKACLVVGGGQVALRKVEGLLEAGAHVRVVAPCIVEMPENVLCIRREFLVEDIDDTFFVIAATDNSQVNSCIAQQAEARGILANIVDDPARGTVILPAVVKRGALQIAISTGGGSPTLARQIRQQLEKEFGPEYGDLITLLWQLRKEYEPRMNTADMAADARRACWHEVLALPLLEILSAGQHAVAEQAARTVLDRLFDIHPVESLPQQSVDGEPAEEKHE